METAPNATGLGPGVRPDRKPSFRSAGRLGALASETFARRRVGLASRCYSQAASQTSTSWSHISSQAGSSLLSQPW